MSRENGIFDEVEKYERHFVKAYNDLIISDLTGNELKLLLYLKTFGQTGHKIFPSFKKINKDIKIAMATISKAIKGLVEKGYLYVEKEKVKNGWRNNYYILDPYYEELRNFGEKKSKYNENDTTDVEQKQRSELLNLYQEKIGQLSPNDIQDLYSWLDDLNSEEQGYDIIAYAIEESEKKDAYSYNYLRSKLRAYNKDDVDTLDKAKIHEKKRNRKNAKSKKSKDEEKRTSFFDELRGV